MMLLMYYVLLDGLLAFLYHKKDGWLGMVGSHGNGRLNTCQEVHFQMGPFVL